MDFVYPEVREGMEVLWAQNREAGPNQWVLGKVYRTKNQSCDIRVENRLGIECHEDSMHADDPRLKTMRNDIDRGVFRISPREIDFQRVLRCLRDLESKYDVLRRQVEDIVMQGQRQQKMKA